MEEAAELLSRTVVAPQGVSKTPQEGVQNREPWAINCFRAKKSLRKAQNYSLYQLDNLVFQPEYFKQ